MSSSVTTILFTDIEGSTRLWEQEGKRMAAALAQHDVRARAAIDSHRGVIVKTTGDGLFAAFPDPLDAVNATVAFLQSLVDPAVTHGIPIRVRCGLHLGVLERRDNDYFGTPVNRTARIMSVAHGGQIVLSQAVVDQVGARLPPETTLRDLGSVRLKDLATPEHIYQVLHPDLRQDFPALRSLEATPNNLPEQLTTFVGRERELAEATDLLKSTRLLTLLGMGGLGKTRLSLQIAADVLDAYPDGIWFLDLAPIRDPSLIPGAAAQTLSLREEPGETVTQTLCAHLKSRKALLIFDNCEQVVSACATLANALLRAAPGIRIIASTREALRIPGEQIYPVLPMALPDPAASVETLLRSEAVQLFMDRAQLQKPGFTLTEKEAPAVAELVARLEGIPLAMELAAARMRSLSIQEINKRLQNRFALLTGGGRVLLERQQTLRALVAWSYDLLTENERLLFDRLGVFVGGFDLPAAEAVCGADPLLPEDVLDLVMSLVDKSLVMVREADGESRYRMLETLREFGQEALVKRGELAATATRHCDHYFVLAKAVRDGLKGAEQAEWIRRAETDLDNLRAAITLALKGGADPVLAVKFEIALMAFRILRGYASEGRNIVRAALALPAIQASDVAQAHALYVGAALAGSQGDHAEARQMLETCLVLRRRLGNPVEIAATLSTLSLARLQAGDAKGASEGEREALEIFRSLGERLGEAIGLLHLGQIAVYTGDEALAQSSLSDCLRIAQGIKNREIEGEAELTLGRCALESGRVDDARRNLDRSLAVCREAGDRRGEAHALWWLGKADVDAGELATARDRLGDALRTFRDFEMREEILGCLEDHALLAHRCGEASRAVALLATVGDARDRLHLGRSPWAERRSLEQVQALRQALPDAEFNAAWQQGRDAGLEGATRAALAPRAAPTSDIAAMAAS